MAQKEITSKKETDTYFGLYMYNLSALLRNLFQTLPKGSRQSLLKDKYYEIMNAALQAEKKQWEALPEYTFQVLKQLKC